MSTTDQRPSHGRGSLALNALIVVATLVALGIGTLEYFGGYEAVRLRGLTRTRVSDLRQAEAMAGKSVGMSFSGAKRAFNDDNSWSLLPTDWAKDAPCDVGGRPKGGQAYEVWMYQVDSSSHITLFVEDGIVIGAGMN